MERDGAVAPKVLKVQPRLPVGLVMYLEAFYELDTERSHTITQHGMSVARIPWSSVVRYAKHYEYDVDELLFFIRWMDDAYIEHLASEQGGGSGGSTGTREMVQRPPRPD